MSRKLPRVRTIKADSIRIGDTIRVRTVNRDLTIEAVGTVAERDHSLGGMTFWHTANGHEILSRDRRGVTWRGSDRVQSLTLLNRAHDDELTLPGMENVA